MKINKKYFIVIASLILACVFIVVKLNNNKKAAQEDIAYSQRTIGKIPVAVEIVKKEMLSENVTTTGTLEASEVLNLVSETQGKIIKIYKKKGENVSQGDLIVKVDDETIAANVLTAEANYSQNEKDVERFKRLAEENAISKRDYEQAQIGLKKAKADLITAQKALSNTSIKAPISGYINTEMLTVGQLLGGGSPVCEIVNNNTLKINVKVTEKEVFLINKGQKVLVKVAAFSEKEFYGVINSIAEKADAAMKFNVEIFLSNNNSKLKSGLYAEVQLPIKNTKKVVIKKECIVGSMESPNVFVVENGKAVKRSLILGQSNDKQVEVITGLSENEQIITSGQINLKDGDEINIIK